MAGIILNESRVAEDVLSGRTLGPHPASELGCVAKLLASRGAGRKEIEGELLLLIERDTGSPERWRDAVESIAERGSKARLVDVGSIPVTEDELAACDSLWDRRRTRGGWTNPPQVSRLLFTMIVLAKFYNMLNEKNNGWVNRPVREVFQLANLSLSVVQQSLRANDLYRAGLIGLSRRVDNDNMQVLCLGGEKVEMEVADMRNLGYRYLQSRVGGYASCEGCGLLVPRRSNRMRYCAACAERKKVEYVGKGKGREGFRKGEGIGGRGGSQEAGEEEG